MRDMDRVLLKAKQVSKNFFQKEKGLRKKKVFVAVDKVDLMVKYKDSIGIVGESGSGKSTLAKMLMQLEKVSSGEIFLEGKDITNTSQKDQLEVYKKMQMVFQEPFASISPRMNIYDFLSSTMLYHQKANSANVKEEVARYLDLVRLSTDLLYRFPHQLSGGQLQRVMIARAISVKPKLIIFDEATSALDVSVQAQILELLMELKEKLGLTYLFISHDLAMVRSVTNQVVVMHHGKVVEKLESKSLLQDAKEEYTKLLLDSLKFE